MDGTFLRPDGTFDRPRLAMLRRRMREDGVRFVVASGNQEAQLLGFFEGEEDGAFIRATQPADMRDCLAFYLPRYETVGTASDLTVRRIDKGSIVQREGVDPALVEELVSALEGVMVPVASGHDCVDVIMPGRHKVFGLGVLLEHSGLAWEQVAAFGDSANDVEMLEAAGTGVAMAGSSEPALAAADAVAPDNAEDGVLAVLEHWFADQAAPAHP